MSPPRWWLFGVLVTGGCAEDEEIPFQFDGPIAAAVLPELAGPFYDPVAFVAGERDGRIVPINLKEGRPLTDDPQAPFLRASPLPTGRDRLLTDVVLYHDETNIDLWAADARFLQLLRVPYMIGVDESGPVEVEPVASVAVFTDTDQSGDSLTAEGVLVRAGYTTTEDWTFTLEDDGWRAEGSRSGVQQARAETGVPYTSDKSEIELTFEGTATAGDTVTLHTDTLMDEVSVGGRISGLWTDGARIYAAVGEPVTAVQVYDGATATALGSVALPEGAVPGRVTGTPDGRVFVADSRQSQLYTLRFDTVPGPIGTPVEVLETSGPIIDVAWQSGLDLNGLAFEHLFVALVGAARVDVYDLVAGEWVDPNPITPQIEGVLVEGPVSGIAASTGAVRLQEETSWGAQPRMPTVVVSTTAGWVYQLDAASGCLVEDELGARGPDPYYDSNDDFISIEDQGEPSNPTLWVDEVTGYQIVGSECGGVTRTESWTVVYDGATLRWEVEGSLSGKQVATARESERYLSDTGAISFLIMPGSLGATDGDRFSFSTSAGLFSLYGPDADEDGAVEVRWEFPARPVPFEYTTGPTGGGWDRLDRRQYALILASGADLGVRLHLDSGSTSVIFQ